LKLLEFIKTEIDARSLHVFRARKNRFTARRYQRGDNLSVGFHIQNSISLTMALLPRII
jgi:hypothetical protein